jgi:hypothetical protein
MIADLNPREFKRDVESIRRWHIEDYQSRADAWWRYNKRKAQEAGFHRRLATTTDPYERCALLGQNLSPRGKPALVLEEKWWKWGGYG